MFENSFCMNYQIIITFLITFGTISPCLSILIECQGMCGSRRVDRNNGKKPFICTAYGVLGLTIQFSIHLLQKL